MNLRRTSLVASLLIAITGIPAVGAMAAPTPVAGKACTTVNKKQVVKKQTFQCVKSGKKLVWKVLVTPSKTSVPAPTPTLTPEPSPVLQPSPTPTPTPKPTPLEAPYVLTPAEKIFYDANIAVKKELPAPNPSVTPEFLIEGSVLAENQRKIAEQVEYIMNAYSTYFSSVKRVTFVEEATQAWGIENIPKTDPSNPTLAADMKGYLPIANPDSPDCKTGGAGGGFSLSYLDHPVVVFNTLNCPFGKQIPVAHETTHAVQSWMIRKIIPTGDANPACFGPAWLREGQAQVGSMTLSYWDKKEQGVYAYYDIVNALENPSDKPNYMQFVEQNDDAHYQQYDMGGMASMYLAAKYGWQKSLDVWTESAKLIGTCQNQDPMPKFAIAFKSVFGFTLDDFYAEVTPLLQYLYDNKLAVTERATVPPQPEGTVRVTLDENCHISNSEASLQRQENGAWVDIASKWGNAKSPCKGLYLPWTYAKVSAGDVLRWHVYIKGAWDWYSQPYTYKG